MAEDAASCKSCIFRLRFGFRRALYEQLFLANEPLVAFVRKLLGIKGDSDVARVMHVFLDVDIRGTHKLDIETFFEYFGIEFSEYNKRAFRLLAFGDGQEGQGVRRGSTSGRSAGISLKFDQFFVSMYNYGTLLHEALVRFAFDVMASGKEFCNRQDVIGLVSLLHSEKARVKDTTNTLMGIMDPHNRDKVSFETFRKEERRLGSMLFPAFKLQKILRAKVLGPWFWRRATKRRRKARLIGANLCREYTRLKAEHLGRLGGPGQRRGSVGQGPAKGATEQGMTEGLDISPAKAGAENEGYHPEGDEEGGRAEGGPSSSSGSGSSGSDADESGKDQFQQQPGGRRVSLSVGGRNQGVPRRVSYAADPAQRGSMSMPMTGVPEQDTGGGRRASALNGSGKVASGRRRSSAKSTASGGYSNNDRRRSSAALAAVSGQGAPGRRGSMFEGMQVYAPADDLTAADASASRRRSTIKGSSRVLPGDQREGEVAERQARAYPATEGGG